MKAASPATRAVVIGCSAGGLDALRGLLQILPGEISAAIVIVSHCPADGGGLLPGLLAKACRLPVHEAREREPVLPGHVYVAPPNYHLLIEPERCFSLSVDERVCFVRPSVDVLFFSAADVYRDQLLGVILTGGNSDGALGLQAVKKAGGSSLVQDPKDAHAALMPESAIALGAADQVLPLPALAARLLEHCFAY